MNYISVKMLQKKKATGPNRTNIKARNTNNYKDKSLLALGILILPDFYAHAIFLLKGNESYVSQHLVMQQKNQCCLKSF